MYDKDIESIGKAKEAVDDLFNDRLPKESNTMAFTGLRKKYKPHFK